MTIKVLCLGVEFTDVNFNIEVPCKSGTSMIVDEKEEEKYDFQCSVCGMLQEKVETTYKIRKKEGVYNNGLVEYMCKKFNGIELK